MIIVISNPAPVADEHRIINQLFDAGLDVFHLRRPDQSQHAIEALLSKIDPGHYFKIAIHQHHGMAEKYGMVRLHYTEEKRKSVREETLRLQKDAGNLLSTSIHQAEEYKALSACFDYCFFGPVFNSISKPGYKPVTGNDFVFSGDKITKVIALGGIDDSQIARVALKGFAGIALLGAVWQSNDPIGKFNRIKELWLKR